MILLALLVIVTSTAVIIAIIVPEYYGTTKYVTVIDLGLGGGILFILLILTIINRFLQARKHQRVQAEDTLKTMKKAEEIKTRGFDEVTKKRFFGLIRLNGKINFQEASKMMGITPEQVKMLLYELAGDGSVTGKLIDDNNFQISSDINSHDYSKKFWTKLDIPFRSAVKVQRHLLSGVMPSNSRKNLPGLNTRMEF